MKKLLLLFSFMLLALTVFSSQVWALTYDSNDIGDVDTFIGSSQENSGYENELAWVQSLLGNTYTIDRDLPGDDVTGVWNDIDGNGSGLTYAMDFATLGGISNEPEYYFIKTGSLSNTSHYHFLFQNLSVLQWGVVDWTQVATSLGVDLSDINIGKISHVQDIGGNPVPEPATMLLFGFGLLGLAGVSRRKN